MPLPFQTYVLQAGTALHQTTDNYHFLLGDWTGDGSPDLFIIKKNQTGTGSTEISILRADSHYQDYALQTGTPQHETDGNFAFALGDWDNDGRQDLVIIKKNQTGTHSTEIGVLSGATNFQTWLLQTGTPLHETGDNFAFAVADYTGDGRPDLFVIKKNQTGTGSTEVSVLSAASNYQDYLLQTGTPLHETDHTFDFLVADWNNDGRPDLIIIKKSATGTGSTEISILSGATRFQGYLLQTGTPQHETDHRFAFAMAFNRPAGQYDLAIIKKSDTTTGNTEIGILR